MKFSKREKLLIGLGALFVAAFILVAGVLIPLIENRKDLAEVVISQDSQLKKVYELSAKIRFVQNLSKKSSGVATDKNFTLFGFLEELGKELGINDRIEYMKPIGDVSGSSKESVELKIRGIYQDDLIGLLYGIDSCPFNLRIKRLNIKRIERDKNLDITFQVVLYG